MNLVIQTKTGSVQGSLENGFYSYKGIPYGKAERFKAPEEYQWDGVLNCTGFGKKAMQVFDNPAPWAKPASREEFSEDCLNLNIYVPESIEENEKLPVLLEIHGGGFQNGSNQGRTPGQVVRNEKIIYAAINYRLGVLGFLYLGELLGKKYQTSGNNGLLDQLLAVKWIYENIDAFGGDPARITVLGASAGGKSIGALMMIPEFSNYAHQLILSSGATQSIRSVKTSLVTTGRFMDTLRNMKSELGISDEEITGEILLKLSPDDLIRVQKKFCDIPGNTCMFGPVADGMSIAEEWQETAIKGTYFHGSVMVGCSRHELGFYKMFNADFLHKAPSISEALFGKNSSIAYADYTEMTDKYKDKNHMEPSDERKEDYWIQILTDYMYRCYSYRIAKRLAAKGCRVWQYQVEFLPALHCSDQGLAFETPNPRFYKNDPDKIKAASVLGDKIWSSFMNFIKNGDPAVNDWTPLADNNELCMYWDTECKVRSIPKDDVLNHFPEDVYILA